MAKIKILIISFIFIIIFVFSIRIVFFNTQIKDVTSFLNKMDSKLDFPIHEGLEKISFDALLTFSFGDAGKGEAEASFYWNKSGKQNFNINKWIIHKGKGVISKDIEEGIKKSMLKKCLSAFSKTAPDFLKKNNVKIYKKRDGFLMISTAESSESMHKKTEYKISKDYLILEGTMWGKDGGKDIGKFEYVKKGDKYKQSELNIKFFDSETSSKFDSFLKSSIEYALIGKYWIGMREIGVITSCGENPFILKTEFVLYNVKVDKDVQDEEDKELNSENSKDDK